VALYSVASELKGEALVAKLTKRALAAMSSMLKTAPELGYQNVDFPVFMLFSAMAGATRPILEAGTPPKMAQNLREHLVLLSLAYLKDAAKRASKQSRLPLSPRCSGLRT
jgi:hypothetical protein